MDLSLSNQLSKRYIIYLPIVTTTNEEDLSKQELDYDLLTGYSEKKKSTNQSNRSISDKESKNKDYFNIIAQLFKLNINKSPNINQESSDDKMGDNSKRNKLTFTRYTISESIITFLE